MQAWWAKVQKKAAPVEKPVAASAPANTGYLGEQKSHVVGKGETWWSISQMYGLGVADLARVNGATPTDTLVAGRELTLVIKPIVVEVEREVEKPVAVTPPSLDRPWWQSKEVTVLAVTGGGLTAGVTVMESFGRVPLQHVIILIVVGLICLAAHLVWSRRNDQKAVANTAARVEAS